MTSRTHPDAVIADSPAAGPGAAERRAAERAASERAVDVLAVGEAMILVAPAEAEALADAHDFRLDTAGAEANVASHLAALGRRAAWAGRVGDDALGRRLLADLADRGVDLGAVEIDPAAPTGVYFKDPGAGVVYHRRGSAASRMGAGFAAALPLHTAHIVHLSGITPALSADCDDLADRLIDAARANGAEVSFDVNHRPTLWADPAVAAARLRELAARADLVFVGLDEAAALWGAADADDVRRILPEPAVLVVKDGAVRASEYGPDGAVHVPSPAVDVVEVVGAGDAFAAGYLDARLAGRTAAERLAAGHARAAAVLGDTADFPRRPRGTADAPGKAPAGPDGPAGRGDASAARPARIDNRAFDDLFAARPVMALFRGLGTERTIELAHRAWDLGIDLVEVPVQRPDDLEALAAVVAAARERGLPVGAGTVVDPDQARAAARAGAAFVVSPGFDPDVVRAAAGAGLPALPGVATATEVQAALRLGLTWLKAFPAGVLGPSWFRTMAGPFPAARFVATGGIDANNAGAFLTAGVRTVAVGSALENPAQLPRLGELLANR